MSPSNQNGRERIVFETVIDLKERTAGLATKTKPAAGTGARIDNESSTHGDDYL
jgi:hypothetical protein